MGVGKNIEAAMHAAGLRPVDIARKLGITDSAVSQWFRKDTGPRYDRLPELAGFLNTTTDQLLHGPAPATKATDTIPPLTLAQAAASMPDISRMEYAIPILGTIAAGDGYFIMGKATGASVRRPPRLEDREDIVSIYVQGEHNAPRFNAGELIYLELLRPPAIGDDVVAVLKEGGRAILGRLAARSPKLLRIQQYNVAKTVEISLLSIAVLYRVMTLLDLLG